MILFTDIKLTAMALVIAIAATIGTQSVDRAVPQNLGISTDTLFQPVD